MPDFWNSDHVFRIGSSHEVCEDYAISTGSTLHPESCIAALSDGCSLCLDSEGKPIQAHTDIGSRIMAHSALRSYYAIHNKGNFGSRNSVISIAQKSLEACAAMSIGLNALSATLSATLLSSWIGDGYFGGMLCGDGVYAVRYRDSVSWCVSSLSFPTGMPWYPRFELSKNDTNRFFESSTTYDFHRFVIQGNSITQSWDVSHLMYANTPPIYAFRSGFVAVDMIVMFSDGISSFVRKDPNSGTSSPVPLEESVAPFLQFTNYRGRFAHRRAKVALREHAQNGITHTDDFSMIALVVG